MIESRIRGENAVALAKRLLPMLEELLDQLKNRPENVTLEQAFDPAAPKYGLALAAERLAAARDVLAEAVTLPFRESDTSLSWGPGSCLLLDRAIGCLEEYLCDAAAARADGGADRADPTRAFVSAAVTVNQLLAEAEFSLERRRTAEAEAPADSPSSSLP